MTIITQEKLILACRGDGFGERVLAFLNAMYIAKKTGLKFGFCWNEMGKDITTKNIEVPNDVIKSEDKIFHIDFIKKYSYTKSLNFTAIDGVGLFLRDGRYSLSKILNYKKMYDFGYVSTQYFLDKICDDVDRNEYYNYMAKAFFDEIKWSDEMQKSIQKAKSLKLGNFISLHIRSGDAMYMRDRRELYFGKYKLLEASLALEFIRKQIKHTNILIFSDNHDIAQQIQNYALKHFNTYDNKLLLANSYTKKYKITDVSSKVVFELTLMSLSQAIYSSAASGFSNLAFCISKARKIKSVYKLFSEKEKFNIISYYLKRSDFDSYQKAFSYLNLYELALSMNLSIKEQNNYLIKAMQLDYKCPVYKILYMDLLLRTNRHLELELYLKNELLNSEQIVWDLLFINVYDRTFLYHFVITKMIELKEHINYPHISYFLGKVYEYMQNDTSIHIKDKNAIEMIKKLQLIHKFVTSIQKR